MLKKNGIKSPSTGSKIKGDLSGWNPDIGCRVKNSTVAGIGKNHCTNSRIEYFRNTIAYR